LVGYEGETPIYMEDTANRLHHLRSSKESCKLDRFEVGKGGYGIEDTGLLGPMNLKAALHRLIDGKASTNIYRPEGESYNYRCYKISEDDKTIITTTATDASPRDAMGFTVSGGVKIADAIANISPEDLAKATKIVIPVSQTKRGHWVSLHVTLGEAGENDKRPASLQYVDSKGNILKQFFPIDHIVKEASDALDARSDGLSTTTLPPLYCGHQGMLDGVNCGRFVALYSKAASQGINPEDIAKSDLENNFKAVDDRIGDEASPKEVTWGIETLEKAALRHARAAVAVAVAKDPNITLAQNNLELLLHLKNTRENANILYTRGLSDSTEVTQAAAGVDARYAKQLTAALAHLKDRDAQPKDLQEKLGMLTKETGDKGWLEVGAIPESPPVAVAAPDAAVAAPVVTTPRTKSDSVETSPPSSRKSSVDQASAGSTPPDEAASRLTSASTSPLTSPRRSRMRISSSASDDCEEIATTPAAATAKKSDSVKSQSPAASSRRSSMSISSEDNWELVEKSELPAAQRTPEQPRPKKPGFFAKIFQKNTPVRQSSPVAPNSSPNAKGQSASTLSQQH